VTLYPAAGVHAQMLLPPKYELRGAWIATAYRLDWPPNNPNESVQKDRMIRLLGYLRDAGINAVFFQIRSFGDAMYDSSYEPWSHLLTGQQGRAPNYDPLEFVIQEARRRGMEVHAWINPYRVHDVVGSHALSDNHVTIVHPEWMHSAGRFVYMDPGREDVRDYVTQIVMDVVRRYDVDGIHFDDYFYPYPPNHFTLSHSPDQQTFQREDRGFTQIEAWRRDNINQQIAQVSDSLRSYNAALKFGVSPFGIWKSGVPRGIHGLNAYDVIFADALEWVNSKTIDYLVPQLYWRFGGGQDYAKLAPWWADQSGDRHLYVGHALYKIDQSQSGAARFSTTEISNQVAFNQSDPRIGGSVFFRADFLHPLKSRRFAETIRNGHYKYPSIPPPMDWKDQSAPAAPFNVTATVQDDSGALVLAWETSEDTPGRYAVYRVTSDTKPNAVLAARDVQNLFALTGELRFTDTPPTDKGKQWYFVQSVSRNSIESKASDIVESPIATDQKVDPVLAPLRIAAYPTVFNEQVQIEYALETSGEVTLQVFDIIGREVTTLVNDEFKQVGSHRFSLSSSEYFLSGGIYWVVLSTNDQRITQAIIHAR